jgi:F-type H+-transporting ATPase subunit alpha
MPALVEELKSWVEESRKRLAALPLVPHLEHIGRVLQVGDGVAMVAGLPQARLDELLVFEGGVRG